MLGKFLEFGVACPDILASLGFYRRLGFAALPVGDIVTTPYAVVAVDQLAVGLHTRAIEGPALTFVRPGVASSHATFGGLGIPIEFADLAADVFHRIAVMDPNEHRLMLLEARTFSASLPEPASVSVCGRFVEWAMPTLSLSASLRFWGGLGFRPVAEGAEPHPWLRLSGFGTTIGLHERSRFAPGLRFESPDLAARLEFLRIQGLQPAPSSPLPGDGLRASLRAPEGTALYLHETALD
jgi:catechol 2,3-dioxygenase-like lactoylglutathione lyase family enzyme